MDIKIAATVIENLIQRNPSLTEIEIESLAMAIGHILGNVPQESRAYSRQYQRKTHPEKDRTIDTSCLSLAPSDEFVTLCIDFGTAMSKAAIVDTANGAEVVHILDLGVPTKQEHKSASMLVSSAYVSKEGLMYFGQEAVDQSRDEALTNGTDRIDNMKRFLSEGDVDELMDSNFNPTSFDLKARDVLLAYLAYFTWACSECFSRLGYPRNIQRKFAVPCLTGERRNQVNNLMLELLGWAQLLADSIGGRFLEGVPVEDLLKLIQACERLDWTFDFVGSDIAEPIAVAASYPGPEAEFKSAFLAIDVGAGTTDFGLFKIAVSAKENYFAGVCPSKSLKVVKEAGNFLDRALRAYVLKISGIDVSHPLYNRANSYLARDMRDLKESLFVEEVVYPTLPEGVPAVKVELAEFLETPAVKSFAENVEQTVQNILEEVDYSWLTANDQIGVLLTGGGASLPMLQGLTARTIEAQGKFVKTVRVHQVPAWLKERNPEIAEQYSRVAVALGGARPYAVQLRLSSITAGDIKSTPVFDGYYQQGS